MTKKCGRKPIGVPRILAPVFVDWGEAEGAGIDDDEVRGLKRRIAEIGIVEAFVERFGEASIQARKAGLEHARAAEFYRLSEYLGPYPAACSMWGKDSRQASAVLTQIQDQKLCSYCPAETCSDRVTPMSASEWQEMDVAAIIDPEIGLVSGAGKDLAELKRLLTPDVIALMVCAVEQERGQNAKKGKASH